MQLTRYDDVQAFYEATSSYLSQHEAQHNLLLGLTAALLVNPYAFGDQRPYLAAVHDENRVVGVALRTPPHHPLHISRIDDTDALPIIAQDVRKKYKDLSNIGGTVPAIQQFVDVWKNLTGDVFEKLMAQRIYQLTEVIPVDGVAGAMRPAYEEDRPLLREWFKGFDRDGLGHEMTDEEADKAVDSRLNDDESRNLVIWEVDGEPVSMAGTSGPTPSGIRVNAVYTPPEHRRKGYASACVAQLSQMMLDSGRKFCFLYTDLSNPTSNHIYQTIGYEAVCDAESYTIKNT